MTLDPDYFDRLYAADPDPWRLDERWYERRKHDLTVAALPAERYARAVEVGCSTGPLTARLAPRCDRLLGIDVAGPALDAARRRLADSPWVTFERRVTPQDWPPGRFDLVVLSEVGYYFGLPDLRRLLTAATGALEPGGTLLAVHWRHPVTDYPLGGDRVHAEIAATPGFGRTVRHEEADFLLEVYRTGPPVSVAEETGLLAGS